MEQSPNNFQLPTNNDLTPPIVTPGAAVPGNNYSANQHKRKLMIAGTSLVLLLAIAAGVLINITSHQSNTTRTLSHTTVAVDITDSGFIPSDILVKPGTQVIWTNTSSSNQQIAANPYPTHTTLPALFSSTIPPHSTYAYTFEKVGHWGYQDFLHPTVNGTVRVSR